MVVLLNDKLCLYLFPLKEEEYQQNFSIYERILSGFYKNYCFKPAFNIDVKPVDPLGGSKCDGIGNSIGDVFIVQSSSLLALLIELLPLGQPCLEE